MGRRTIRLTEEQILKAIKGSFGIMTTIAKRLGIDRNTALKYVNQNEATRQALINEQEACGDLAETKLLKLLNDGDGQSIRWYLGRKFAARGYSEKIETKDTTPTLRIVTEDNELKDDIENV